MRTTPTTKSGNRTTGGYTTDKDNRLTSDGIYNYTYDAEGNRTRRTTISDSTYIDYTYDHRNRLTDVVYRTSGGVATKALQYVYDVNDRRIERRLDAAGDGVYETKERYIYDAEDIVLIYDGGNALVNRYLHGPDMDQPVAEESSAGVVKWLLPDEQGSIRDVGDNAGNLVAGSHVVYNSFGVATTGTAGRYGYTGREWDVDAGMYYYRARWYDASVGRFISQDPKGFDAGDANLYRYVGNSSPNAEDPTGMNATRGWSTSDDWRSQILGGFNSSASEGPTPEVAKLLSKPTFTNNYAPGTSNYNLTLRAAAFSRMNDALADSDLYGFISERQRVAEIDASISQLGGQRNQQASDANRAGGYNPQITVWTGVKRGGTNVIVGTGKALREVGYQAADFANTTEFFGFELYHGNLSQLGKASVRDDFSYGQHVTETGANVVTLGVYGEAKLTYQYYNGEIDLDTYSQGMGANGVFQTLPGGIKYGRRLASRFAAENAGVGAYEVDTYGNLRSRSLVGDMLDLDHQPSNASNIARAEAELGRPLTAAERVVVRDQGTAVAVPQQWHRSLSPTYGARNTAAQIQADALNPAAAALRDSKAMINGASAVDRAAAGAAAARIRQSAGGR